MQSAGQGRTLWLGEVEPWMDENFVTTAFLKAGHPALQVKRIMNRQTGNPAGYCFVDFADAGAAERALASLQGQPIPGSQPPKTFRLNWASYSKDPASGPEYSIFVGDLSPDVTDSTLLMFFQRTYPSCRNAKVVTDTNGRGRGYGFVRFGDETEQQRALADMNGAYGCGSKPIRVGPATPRNKMDGMHSQPMYNMPYGGAYFPPTPPAWGSFPGYDPAAYAMYQQAYARQMQQMAAGAIHDPLQPTSVQDRSLNWSNKHKDRVADPSQFRWRTQNLSQMQSSST